VLGQRIDRGICVSIAGPLGAGKTELVRGVCSGLDIAEQVLSPSFILYEEFAGRIPVVHLDLYRLEHEDEIENLGVFDLVGTDTGLLVEWGDRSEGLLAASDLVITIVPGDGDIRTIDFEFGSDLLPMLGKRDTW